MDMMNAIVIGTVFCALIVSLFMVAYRYNAMSREIKTLGGILKKQVKAQSGLSAQILERLEQLPSPGVKSGTADTPPVNHMELKALSEMLSKLDARLDDLAALWTEHLDEWHVENKIESIPPQPESPAIASERGDLKQDEPVHEINPIQPSGEDAGLQVSAVEVSYNEKTAVRCPNCARQLPYDALKIQDEQTCPYCQEVFRSNSYLLALINERQGARLPVKPADGKS